MQTFLGTLALSLLLLLGQRGTFVAQNTSHGASVPTFIASAVNSGSATFGTSLTVTYSPTGGDTLYYFVAAGTGTISSLTDSTGSPTVVTSSQTWNTTGSYEVFRLTGVSGGSHTITANYGGSPTYGIINVVELSGSTTTGNTSNSTGTLSTPTTPLSCGSLTTSAGSLVLAFGFTFDGGATLVAGSSAPTFTVPSSTGTGFNFANVEYSPLTTATTYSITNGFGNSGGSANQPYFCTTVEAKP